MEKTLKNIESFKICTFCQKEWDDLLELLHDSDLVINGYQASFDDSMEGIFLLTHHKDDCGTTIAIKSGKFRELYEGPDYKIHNAFSPTCEGHCSVVDDLEPCKQECDMRWARDIIQVLKHHGKKSTN